MVLLKETFVCIFFWRFAQIYTFKKKSSIYLFKKFPFPSKLHPIFPTYTLSIFISNTSSLQTIDFYPLLKSHLYL